MDAKEFRALAIGAGGGTGADAVDAAKEAGGTGPGGEGPAGSGRAPPEGLNLALRALWHLARGEWDAAHACAQRQSGRDGAWVHAHLHRVEGDLANAGYWYRRAERPPADSPLDAEWEEIATVLLAAETRIPSADP